MKGTMWARVRVCGVLCVSAFVVAACQDDRVVAADVVIGVDGRDTGVRSVERVEDTSIDSADEPDGQRLDTLDAVEEDSRSPVAEPVCGDGLCEGSETCASCEQDCGACSQQAPSPVIDWSSHYDLASTGEAAFDGMTSTRWLTALNPPEAWISYDFGVVKTIRSYTITYSNGSCCQQRGPRDFQLEGWTGGGWTPIDSRTGEVDWYTGENRRTFNVSAPGAYRAYRLVIDMDNYDDVGLTMVSIGELVFSE